MTSVRRRTRTGLPVALLIAVLAAIYGAYLSRQSAPASAGARVGARPTPITAAPTGAPRDAAPATPTPRGDSPAFTSRAHLVEHFEKHGGEFPGLDINAYLRAAQTLRDRPVGGTVLELRRRDGVITRFDTESGAFLAVNRDGTIRTFFRPNDGEAYFRRQASRSPGGGR